MRVIPITENLTLSQLAEFIAIVTTFSIIIGVCYKAGFYQSKDIDALWVLQLFNPSDFIKANLEVYGFYIIAALYMAKVFDQKIEERGLELITQSIIIVSLALFFYFVIDLPMVYFAYILSSFCAFYLILYQKNVGKSVGILILLFLPWHMGGSEASPENLKSLPHVALSSPIENLDWYLLDKYSDKAILINKGTSKNSFKIVDLKDIKYIESISN